MENASKALIIAGSILMSMLVIGILLFMYGSIRDLEQVRVNTEQVTKQEKYTKDIEAYGKNIYGSELLSLANLLADYNLNQAKIKGYTEIVVEVKLKTPIEGKDGRVLLTAGKHKIQDVHAKMVGTLKGYISDYEKNKVEYNKNKKTIKQWSQMSNLEIYYLLGIKGAEYTDDIETILKKKGYSKLYTDIQNYVNLKTTETAFKSTVFVFNSEKVKYGPTGRIEYMLFEEYKEKI